MKRIQRRRTKGWRMPAGAIYVGRPSPWGNPFPVDGAWISWTSVALGYRADAAGRRRAAVELYRAWLTGRPTRRGDELGDLSEVEYTDGSTATISDLAEGLAAVAASIEGPPTVPAKRPDIGPLRGHDVACYCPRDQPCHADVLLELAA